MNIVEKLLKIQTELKAPKGQRNAFGKYNYRSAEDILEAAKPICKKHKCLLKITEEIKELKDERNKDRKRIAELEVLVVRLEELVEGP